MAIPSFTNILKTLSPDLLIYDFNQPWAPTIASSYNIPAVDFIPSGVTMPSFTLHLRMKGGVEFPFPAIQLQGFHKMQFGNMIKTAANRAKNKEGPLDAMKRSCNIILFHTFRELEGQYVDYLAALVEKKIVPAGSLVREIDDEDDHTEIIEWLDNKDESSTVFVSFGSESFMSKDEIEEIAHGLELSKVNFIWVVRFPVGEKVEIEEALPKGFLGRLGERGMVVEGWAPQARILTHSSIGGFVSHCGWNSVMESLKFGVPIVAMPMHYDQPFNARLVEEIGAAVEVNRGINGRLNREDIAQVIRTVVVEKSGEDIRIKAREYSEKIRMKGEEEIDEVVEELLQLYADHFGLWFRSTEMHHCQSSILDLNALCCCICGSSNNDEINCLLDCGVQYLIRSCGFDFIPTGAAMTSSTLHMFTKRGGAEFPFPEIQLRGFHETRFRNLIKKASANKDKNKEEGVVDAMKRSRNIILFHTFRELEGKYIDYLSVLIEKKIVPVGSLVREIDDEDEHSEIIQWLDNKGGSSTVFVSFGSEYFMSKDEIEEIAHGLELSNVNFIWVVRFPMGEKVELEEALPKGFIERVGERGMVVDGWAPQPRILTHSSTGGFVSHCGWNSIMESLKFGVPIVAMPMHLDQPLNARLVEEVGVAMEVNRDINGRFNREDISQVIRKVVVEKSGEDISTKDPLE
ncbi:hypothetical protein TEA_015134 [Camellia sinensis var. sinensis]|uniref:UDP-glycosyltransferases domain-containing protein n=1 Tax=Camellia sinensis var. sinensis TaxID=542762 RepID=A0A4S4DHX9_CAMSN|nr:hypothetical protein TEA_015134 [Camellia sinensis var. sinensis]